jgi:hypothetical protein
MSFESAITIILTVLAVMLGVVTIGIAALAIWGYFGILDSVKETAAKKVDEAMVEALKKYPKAADMLALVERLSAYADVMDQIRDLVVAGHDPKVLVTASKPVVQEGVPETPLDSMDQQVTPIAKYPGEVDKDDASDSGQSS